MFMEPAISNGFGFGGYNIMAPRRNKMVPILIGRGAPVFLGPSLYSIMLSIRMGRLRTRLPVA